jgi:hypothetical protein
MRGTFHHQLIAGAMLSIALGFIASTSPATAQAQPKLSDAQIRQILIDDSKRGYSGPCPVHTTLCAMTITANQAAFARSVIRRKIITGFLSSGLEIV